ncbi:MAG: ABC transporter ATP-binding protein/permease [Ruminococcus sp.]|nr:ABC transporter ATP-binding protein/permease [Ruminococcus sp.]MDY4909862.1 ABC transporter ATP-binding protein [Candidatus Fimenecus sp.]
MIKLLKYAKKYIFYTLLSPLLMVGEVIFELLIPQVMADIVETIRLTGTTDPVAQQEAIQTILALGGKMLTFALCSLFCGAMAARLASVAGMGFGAGIRNALIEKVQTFSFSNIDRFSTASLITRTTTDITTVQNTFLMLIRGLFRAPIMLVTALAICIKKSKEVTSVFGVALPIILIVLAIAGPILIKRFKAMLKKFDGFNASIQENLTNIRVVKSFVRTDYEKKKFKAANDDLYNASIYAEKLMILGEPLLMVLLYCTIFAVIVVSTKVIANGSLLVGEFTAIFTYIMQIIMSFLMTIAMVAQLFMSEASAKRIAEVLDEEPDIKDPENALETLKDASVEFKNVSFSYNEGKNIINNASFKINSGEMVGIMGATGSSKSSLVQLIARLYDVTGGEVLVGGENVKKYKLHSLRENVSMVLQKNVLFSGTIADNLRWGNKNATDEELRNACKIADADEFVSSFPDGYQTDLGQGGVNVSGGQKQRLCIARAILKSPKILILDDSTSAVDSATDARIRQGLRESLPSTTKIIIAQRVSSISDCDKIIILDNGTVNDIGTHEELLERNEIYRDVYTSQQKGTDDFDEVGGEQ